MTFSEVDTLVFMYLFTISFQKMTQICKSFCKECSSCLEIKGNKSHPIGISTYPLLLQPFSRIYLDTIGPLPKVKNANNKNIFAYKDFWLDIQNFALFLPEKVNR